MVSSAKSAMKKPPTAKRKQTAISRFIEVLIGFTYH
jgi:hypothetical protein